MSEYTFSVPIGSVKQIIADPAGRIHAARNDGNGTAVTACGISKSIAVRNPIILDITETTCQKCLDAMGWQTGILHFAGNDIPVRGTKEQLEKWGARPV